MFRLSRVEGDVRTERPGSFTVPDGTDLRALSQSLAPPRADSEATVLVRTDAALGLRRRAQLAETGVSGPDGGTGWDRMTVRYSSTAAVAGELLGYADAVVAEAPADLREAVVDRLRRMEVSG
jgi:proteasome accessory factor B